MRIEVIGGQEYLIADDGTATKVVASAPAAVAPKGAKAKVTKAPAAQTFTPTLESFRTADGTRWTLRVWAYNGRKGGAISPAEAEALLTVGDAKAIELLRAIAAKRVVA